MISLTELKFKLVYWIVNRLDKHKKLHFMNFGYSDPGQKVSLNSEDESNRYCIQLYQHLTDLIDLKGKDIVEIGSGRGGGLAYIAKNSSANNLKGIDLSESAIEFSSKHHVAHNLSFHHGDAQKLPLKDASADVVLNVESSHRYLKMDQFLSEVVRIMRNGGHFLFTDFRYDYEWDELHQMFLDHGFRIICMQDITPCVVHALELDDKRRRNLVKELAPGYLQNAMLNFSGAIGSETYSYFMNRKYVYRSYVFQKV